MKHILIPTDFSIKSLRLVAAAAEQFKEESLKIYLVHALEPDSSISNLMFFRRRSKNALINSDSFLEACEILKNKYSSIITNIHIEFYFGQSNIYKKNFLEARNIDIVLLSLNYKFEKCYGDSRDPFEVWKQKFVPVQYHSITEMGASSGILSESKAALMSANS